MPRVDQVARFTDKAARSEDPFPPFQYSESFWDPIPLFEELALRLWVTTTRFWRTGVVSRSSITLRYSNYYFELMSHDLKNWRCRFETHHHMKSLLCDFETQQKPPNFPSEWETGFFLFKRRQFFLRRRILRWEKMDCGILRGDSLQKYSKIAARTGICLNCKQTYL